MAALEGKAIIIVGGTTGLGLSAARACAKEGANLVVFGKDAETGAAAEAEFGAAVSVLTGDAQEPAAIDLAIDVALQRFGRVDGLFHVAGGSGRKMGDGPLHEISDAGWEGTLRLNLTSMFVSNRAVVRQFMKQQSPGVVLNMGSVLGFSPSPHFFATHAYAAAKAGAIGFTRSCAAYYAAHNIRFNVIAPALVETPMSRRAVENPAIRDFLHTKQPLDGGRIGAPQDIDGAVVFLLSDAARFITGQVLSVDGGWCLSDGQIPEGLVSESISSGYAIGIDIGATRIKAVAVRHTGELLDSRFAATGDADEAWKTAVPALVNEFTAKLGPAASIGVSSPGLARRDHRAIVWMRGRLSGVEGYDWSDAIGRGKSVAVLNDAHAALLGEAWIGAARGQRDAVLLTLGTGVGGAILCDGRLLHGHLGRAGHLGHISLNPDGPPDIIKTPGSLEDLIGEHSLSRRSNGQFASTRNLVEAWRNGDTHADRIWRALIRALAAAIASIINAVDPAIVVLGGGIAGAGDALFGPLRDDMDRFEWRPVGAGVPIVPAQLGEMAGAYGAARFAIDRMETAKDPHL